MAQLSDDCFAFGTRLVPIDEALAQVREQLQPIAGTETVSLTDALGRILAEDVVADRSVPPHDNAAVDGYAVFFDDLAAAGPTVLPVTGRVAAGFAGLRHRLRPGRYLATPRVLRRGTPRSGHGR